jgi:tetratricopeptide (TPR) repeat protein
MQAQELAREALTCDPANSKTLLRLGTIEASLKDVEAARKHFKAAHEIDSSDESLLGAWGRLEAQCGNIEQARSLFQQALSLREDNVVALQVGGLHCHTAWHGPCGAMTTALSICCAVRAAFGTFSNMAGGVMQEWAVAETKQSNFEEARRLFLKALTLKPRHIPAIGGLAHAESLAGELHSARNLYARALKVGALTAKSVHHIQNA